MNRALALIFVVVLMATAGVPACGPADNRP
jgi:hypothetical protein